MCYTIKSNAYTIHMFRLFVVYKSILWLAYISKTTKPTNISVVGFES